MNKLFRNETPPPLTITFDEALPAFDSVVVRFALPHTTDAVIEAAVAMDGTRKTGTVTLDDLTGLTDGVYDCFTIGILGGEETALFETPTQFIVRSLPTVPATP